LCSSIKVSELIAEHDALDNVSATVLAPRFELYIEVVAGKFNPLSLYFIILDLSRLLGAEHEDYRFRIGDQGEMAPSQIVSPLMQ